MGILEDNIAMGESSIYSKNQLRIRTKRRRKRTSIEARDKKLIRLYKEEKELRKRKYNLPMIDLSPPIQKGYKRFFVVREDVKRSKMGSFYENLLQKINTFQYSSTKIFKKKAKRKGKKVLVDIEQKLSVIYPHELKKLKLDERQLNCFEYKIVLEVLGKTIREKHFYEFKEPWRYVLRIRPNMIDKVKAFDSELEQRIAELDTILYENHKNNGRLIKMKGWSRYIYKNQERCINPLKNKSLNQIIKDFE
ncbi:hypothetical protein [Emticicia oligotrophica]|uniref:hypothetical protein n=1 Tax=Emticicia oligotrophica TaxID=312279 RepID=UPI00273B546C|nr:hypothetical protein [Emticicia oligotrophica]